MLLIKTRIGLSNIQGVGLFADEDIPQETAVCINKDDFGIIRYSEDQWREMEKNLSPESFRQIKRYTYKLQDDGLYWLSFDDTRFINHSTEPNIETRGEQDFAIQNIRKGEEILIDYTTFYDPGYLDEILKL